MALSNKDALIVITILSLINNILLVKIHISFAKYTLHWTQLFTINSIYYLL